MSDEKHIKQEPLLDTQRQLTRKFYRYLCLKLEREQAKEQTPETKRNCEAIARLKEKYEPGKWKGSCLGFSILLLPLIMISLGRVTPKIPFEDKERKQESKAESKMSTSSWKEELHTLEKIKKYFKKVLEWGEEAEDVWVKNSDSNESSLEQIFEELIFWVEGFHREEKRNTVKESVSSLNYRKFEFVSKTLGSFKLKKEAAFSTFIEYPEELDFLVDLVEEQAFVEITSIRVLLKKNADAPIYKGGHSIITYKNGWYCVVDINHGTVEHRSRDREVFKKMIFDQVGVKKKDNMLLAINANVFSLVRKGEEVFSQPHFKIIRKKLREYRRTEFNRMIRSNSPLLHDLSVKDIIRFLLNYSYGKEDIETFLFASEKAERQMPGWRKKEFSKIENIEKLKEILVWTIKDGSEEYKKISLELIHIVFEQSSVADKFPSLDSTFDEDDNTLIGLAAKHNNAYIFDCLLKFDIEPQLVNFHEENLLHLAAGYLSFDIVEIITQKFNGYRVIVNQQDVYGMTPLMSVLKYNASHLHTPEMIRKLHKMGADLEIRNKKGDTALEMAIKIGSILAVKELLSLGAKFATENKQGRAPLVGAMEQGNHEIVNALLSVGAEARLSDLILAVKGGYINVVAQLISRGINPNICISAVDGKHAKTTLALALENGDMEMAKLLAEHHPISDPFALHLAVKKGQIEIAQYLLAVGTKPTFVDNLGRTTLHEAVLQGNAKLVEILLHRHAEKNLKNKKGLTPLSVALRKGYMDVARVLIKHGAQPSNIDILFAAKWGEEEIFAWLLKKNLDIQTCNANGWNVLHYAAFSGKVGIVKKLLELGLNVNTKNAFGFTPLSVALGGEKSEVAQILLAHKGIEPNTTDMVIAAERGQTAMVRLLLKAGVKPDEKGYREAPFRLALQKGHKDTAELLAESKEVKFRPSDIFDAAKSGSMLILNKLFDESVDPNLRNSKGQTPLHVAALYGHVELINRLLEKGAVLTIKDEFGKTPLEYAREKNHEVAIAILAPPSALQAVTLFKPPVGPVAPVDVVVACSVQLPSRLPVGGLQ